MLRHALSVDAYVARITCISYPNYSIIVPFAACNMLLSPSMEWNNVTYRTTDNSRANHTLSTSRSLGIRSSREVDQHYISPYTQLKLTSYNQYRSHSNFLGATYIRNSIVIIPLSSGYHLRRPNNQSIGLDVNFSIHMVMIF